MNLMEHQMRENTIYINVWKLNNTKIKKTYHHTTDYRKLKKTVWLWLRDLVSFLAKWNINIYIQYLLTYKYSSSDVYSNLTKIKWTASYQVLIVKSCLAMATSFGTNSGKGYYSRIAKMVPNIIWVPFPLTYRYRD